MAKTPVPPASNSAIDHADVAKIFEVLKGMNLDISDSAIGDAIRFGNAAGPASREGGCDPHDCNPFKPSGCSGVKCPHQSSACGTEACSPKVCANHTCESVSCTGVTCKNFHKWGDESSALGAVSEAIARLPSGSWSRISCSPVAEPRPE